MNNMNKIDRKIKKKRVRLVAIITLLIISIFFILYTRTSFFHISAIEVSGNEKIADDKLILASGIIIGENIFKINLKMAEENILQHPYIKDVDINRKLPDKIEIIVEERKEIAIIDYAGSYIYVDEEGIILNILSEKNNSQIVEINGIEINNPKVSQKVEFDNKEMEDKILELVIESRKLGLSDSLSTINFDENNKITFYLDDGGEVAFGTLDDVKYKLNFLVSILKELENKNQGFKKIHLDKGDNAIIIKDID